MNTCPDCAGTVIHPDDRHQGVCDRCAGTGHVPTIPPEVDASDAPSAPVYFSADAAYGWSCGWVAGYNAARAAMAVQDAS